MAIEVRQPLFSISPSEDLPRRDRCIVPDASATAVGAVDEGRIRTYRGQLARTSMRSPESPAMTALISKCLLAVALVICVAAAPFRPSASSAVGSPKAGAFATAMLEVGQSRWAQEGRESLSGARDSLASNLRKPAPEVTLVETTGGATTCPVEHTECPVDPTVCPTVDTRCPVHQTVCVQTECPKDDTHCPVKETICVTTECPDNPTYCPLDGTKCPEIPTHCPVTSTKCPKDDTRCPRRFTACPSEDTRCPTDPTKCEWTVCPEDPTHCPWRPTECPFILTECPTCVCGLTYDAGPPVGVSSPVPAESRGRSMLRNAGGEPAPTVTYLPLDGF